MDPAAIRRLRTWRPVSPDNVQETGVSPGGRSGSAIVAAEAEQVERTRRKTCSRARIEVICALQEGGSIGDRRHAIHVTGLQSGGECQKATISPNTKARCGRPPCRPGMGRYRGAFGE